MHDGVYLKFQPKYKIPEVHSHNLLKTQKNKRQESWSVLIKAGRSNHRANGELYTCDDFKYIYIYLIKNKCYILMSFNSF